MLRHIVSIGPVLPTRTNKVHVSPPGPDSSGRIKDRHETDKPASHHPLDLQRTHSPPVSLSVTLRKKMNVMRAGGVSLIVHQGIRHRRAERV